MKIRITFTEPLLGTVSGNKELTEQFIASKNPDVTAQQSEVDAVPDIADELQKTSTVFARDEKGKPMLWDYQVKGFLKAACKAMIDSEQFTKEHLKKVNLTNYTHKRTIDQLVFVKPRRITLNLPKGTKELGFCQRPLRGQTMKGERIALARSEEAPAGTTIDVEIECLNKKLPDIVKIWLTYGELSGIGQWRNSGCGRFKWELISE